MFRGLGDHKIRNRRQAWLSVNAPEDFYSTWAAYDSGTPRPMVKCVDMFPGSISIETSGQR